MIQLLVHDKRLNYTPLHDIQGFNEGRQLGLIFSILAKH